MPERSAFDFVIRIVQAPIDPLLRVCVAENRLLAVGPEAALPWVDQAVWLGRDGQILTPTHLRPDLPADLIASRVRADHGNAGVVVLTPNGQMVANLAAAAPTADMPRQWAEQVGEQ